MIKAGSLTSTQRGAVMLYFRRLKGPFSGLAACLRGGRLPWSAEFPMISFAETSSDRRPS
jgi:hypothetical protein